LQRWKPSKHPESSLPSQRPDEVPFSQGAEKHQSHEPNGVQALDPDDPSHDHAIDGASWIARCLQGGNGMAGFLMKIDDEFSWTQDDQWMTIFFDWLGKITAVYLA